MTQGMFVGSVSGNFDERIEQKIFHAEIVVDNEKVSAETTAYKKILQILSFTDEHGNDNMKQVIEANYRQVKADILQIVENEMGKLNIRIYWSESRMTRTYSIWCKKDRWLFNSHRLLRYSWETFKPRNILMGQSLNTV